MLNRARKMAEQHTELKKQIEQEYDTTVAKKVGRLAGVAEALREYDEGFYVRP